MIIAHADAFFSTARERYRIMLCKNAGQPRAEWTTDPIYMAWRFCNVHREDDRTTVWFRENVRRPIELRYIRSYERNMKMTESTINFRWFNRIETGQLVQDLLTTLPWDSEEARRRLDGVAPVVTGAYIIKGMNGMSKLDGVLICIDKAAELVPPMVSSWWELAKRNELTLRIAWNDLTTVPYLGKFMAYELVSDLRWNVLEQATDILTWANAGPGCTRGLGRAVSGDLDQFSYGSAASQMEMLDVMRQLLEMSRDAAYWPSEWKPWEMREVEHWSCEFDKYCRVQGGERMKRRY